MQKHIERLLRKRSLYCWPWTNPFSSGDCSWSSARRKQEAPHGPWRRVRTNNPLPKYIMPEPRCHITEWGGSRPDAWEYQSTEMVEISVANLIQTYHPTLSTESNGNGRGGKWNSASHHKPVKQTGDRCNKPRVRKRSEGPTRQDKTQYPASTTLLLERPTNCPSVNTLSELSRHGMTPDISAQKDKVTFLIHQKKSHWK